MGKLLFAGAIAALVWATPVAAQSSLAALAEGLADAATVPAAVVARLSGDGTEVAVAGVRVVDGEDPALPEDAWHVGSLTKSMTATLAARMVDAGLISWDTRIGAVLGDTYPEMHADWHGTPLRALLTHLSGMEPNLDAASAQRMGDSPRSDYVEEVLSAPPAGTPGEFLYSNAGYVVAGAMLEAVGGASWEDLITTEVFEPLGVESADFGPPQGNAIQGHRPGILWGIRAAGQGLEADNIPAMGPAGRVHLNAEDMLRYLQAHLLRDVTFLRDGAWEELHRGVGDQNYAMGWGVGEDGSLVHSGSNTLWYAVAYVDPASGRAVFVAVNTGDIEAVVEPVDAALRALLEAL